MSFIRSAKGVAERMCWGSRPLFGGFTQRVGALSERLRYGTIGSFIRSASWVVERVDWRLAILSLDSHCELGRFAKELCGRSVSVCAERLVQVVIYYFLLCS